MLLRKRRQIIAIFLDCLTWEIPRTLSESRYDWQSGRRVSLLPPRASARLFLVPDTASPPEASYHMNSPKNPLLAENICYRGCHIYSHRFDTLCLYSLASNILLMPASLRCHTMLSEIASTYSSTYIASTYYSSTYIASIAELVRESRLYKEVTSICGAPLDLFWLDQPGLHREILSSHTDMLVLLFNNHAKLALLNQGILLLVKSFLGES